MAITEINTYDQCERPNCQDDITVEFVSVPSSICHLETASVSWRILGTNSSPSLMEVYYSLNTDYLDNKVGSSPSLGVYAPGIELYSLIPYAGTSGILYFQARAIVDGSIYKSDIITTVVAECDANCFPGWKVDPSSPGDMITDVYLEFSTYITPDQIQILGNYNSETCTGNVLYDTGCTSCVDSDTYSSYYPPTLFNSTAQAYGNNSALYLNTRKFLSDQSSSYSNGIWYDCFQIHESDLPLGIKVFPNCATTSSSTYAGYLLGPDFSQFWFKTSNNQDEDCITVRGGVGTIDYQTYSIRDDIIIFTGEFGDPCNDPIDDDKVLWRSGCVGTSRGEGPGVVGSSKWGATGKVDTFHYAESDLPLYVSVLPNCESTTGTAWCAKVTLQDGTVIFDECGRDTPVCEGEEEPPGLSQLCLDWSFDPYGYSYSGIADGDNNPIIVGQHDFINSESIWRLDDEGNELSAGDFNSTAVRCALDSNNKVFVAGTRNGANLRRFSLALVEEATYDTGVGIQFGVAVDASDNVISCGDLAGGYTVRKLNNDLSSVLNGYNTGGGIALRVAIDSNGNVFVVGHDSVSATVWKLNSNLGYIDSVDTGSSLTSDVAIDSSDNVIVVGTNEAGPTVWKYDNNLNPLWNYDTGATAYGVSLQNDNVIVAGTRNNSSGSYLSVWKLDKDGDFVWGYDTGDNTYDSFSDNLYNVFICGVRVGGNSVWKFNPCS